MPTAAQTFSQIAGPQEGPFSAALRPQPIDTMRPAGQWATGYESPAVGAGQVALDFLKGVRQKRLAEAKEQDANVETQINNFRAQVNAKLQDPDLTDEGRQAILDEANGILNQHMQYELRDVKDKDGIHGFFKNLLVNAAGGPIKSREPINWDEATGRIANRAMGHSQQQNFNDIATRATAAIQQLGDNPDPWVVRQTVSQFVKEMATRAPSKMEAFNSIIEMNMPATWKEQLNARIARRIGGMGTATPPGASNARATTPPPQPPAQMSVAPTLQSPLLLQGLAPSVQPAAQPAAAPAAPQNIRPADTDEFASLNPNDPADRAILGELGYKVSDPVTLWDPKTNNYQANAVRHPITKKWEDAATGEVLPQSVQSWVPHNEISRPNYSSKTLIWGSPGDPTGDPYALVWDKDANTLTPRLDEEGRKIYVSGPMELIPGETPSAPPRRGSRGQAAGTPPQPTLEQQREEGVRSAVTRALQRAGNDYLLAKEQIMGDTRIPRDVATEAASRLQTEFNKLDPLSADGRAMTRAANARARARKPQQPAAPAAQATTPAAAPAAPAAPSATGRKRD